MGLTKSQKISQSMDIIVEALKEDQSEGSYYHSWKANIAMAFYDEFESQREPEDVKSSTTIAEIANEAADRFLEQLCG